MSRIKSRRWLPLVRTISRFSRASALRGDLGQEDVREAQDHVQRGAELVAERCKEVRAFLLVGQGSRQVALVIGFGLVEALDQIVERTRQKANLIDGTHGNWFARGTGIWLCHLDDALGDEGDVGLHGLRERVCGDGSHTDQEQGEEPDQFDQRIRPVRLFWRCRKADHDQIVAGGPEALHVKAHPPAWCGRFSGAHDDELRQADPRGRTTTAIEHDFAARRRQDQLRVGAARRVVYQPHVLRGRLRGEPLR
jgi:hypothetical protein